MTQLKYWYSPGACSLGPHIILNEAGLKFELIKAQFSPTPPTFPEWFSAVNPKMRIPVLGIGDSIITEIPSIMVAISSMAPEKKLLGTNLVETARVHEWMCWLSGTLHGQGFAGLWRPHRFSEDPQAYGSIQKKGQLTIKECFEFIEERLSGPYSIGNSFTTVDAYLLVFWRWGNEIGLDMQNQYPNYGSVISNVAGRDSVKATLEAEQIAL